MYFLLLFILRKALDNEQSHLPAGQKNFKFNPLQFM